MFHFYFWFIERNKYFNYNSEIGYKTKKSVTKKNAYFYLYKTLTNYVLFAKV